MVCVLLVCNLFHFNIYSFILCSCSDGCLCHPSLVHDDVMLSSDWMMSLWVEDG